MYYFNTLKDLLNEFSYSWYYPDYDILKCEDGYSLNKLFIAPDKVTYKTEAWTISPKAYADFERFYEFLQTTDG